MRHRQRKSCTVIAALRRDRVEAPWLLDGSISGERILAPVERGFAPTLKPRDIVIRKNLGSHQAKAVHGAIRAADAALSFPPKYAPGLKPIEQV